MVWFDMSVQSAKVRLNISTIRAMLQSLCEEREVPDIEFFINRRDFPIITRHGTEPYNHIWNTQDQPLVSHRYEKYAPVMSMAGGETFADILIPTFEDWARVEQPNGRYYLNSCRSYDVSSFDVPWEDRIPTAVFRGGSTGAGVTTETNPRLKAALMSEQLRHTSPDDGITAPYLDAGITKWNIRPRTSQGDPYLRNDRV